MAESGEMSVGPMPIVELDAQGMGEPVPQFSRREAFKDRLHLPRLGRKGRFAAGATIAAMSMFGLAGDQLPDPVGEFADEHNLTIGDGIAPTPNVNAATTDMMIALNKTTQEVGQEVLYGALAAIGAVTAAGAVNKKMGGVLESIRQDNKNSRVEHAMSVGFLALIMASSAAASGLAEEAGNGATAPVRMSAEAAGQEGDEVVFVTEHRRVLPMNRAVVTNEELGELELIFPEADIDPYRWEFGSVRDPELSDIQNPSGGPLITLPADAIADTLGIDLSQLPPDADGEFPVLVGEQLGVPAGGTIEVEGHSAHVAATFESFPGLDRVAAVTSFEATEGTLDKGQGYSGVVVAGDDVSAEQVQAAMDEMGLDLSALTPEELAEKTQEFFDRAVSPPEMLMTTYIALLGGAAVMFMGVKGFSDRRGEIADLRDQDVSNKVLILREMVRSGRNLAQALPFAGGLGLYLVNTTNASQYGLNQSFGATSAGAGLMVAGLSAAASAATVGLMTRRVNAADEVR